MSILPFHKQGSADSSFALSPPQNPPPQHSNHGFHHHHLNSPVRSLSISDHQSSNFSGSLSSDADHSHDVSSAEIKNEQDKQPSGQNSAHQTVGEILHHEIADQAAGVVSIPHQAKSSGSTVTPNADHISAPLTAPGTSTTSAGRKTQMVSGNHLLNFHYDPIARIHPRPWVPPPRRQQRRKPYNKDLFLQANYKFVMLDSGNYALEYMDPDKMLHWEDIICLKYFTPLQVQCPICLDDPLCPQITSCGHIFCFPCVLQYFMLGEDDHRAEYSKKCPLCFMMISSKDLFTVGIKNVNQYHVGDTIEFWLLTRQKDSFVLSLKNNEGINAIDEVQDSFSKFTFTSDIDLSVREAMSDLDSWLARADSGLVDDLEKLPYVCTAIKLLEQRRKYWNERQASNGLAAHGHKSSLATFPGSHNTKVSNIGINPCEPVQGSPSDSMHNQSVWLPNSVPDKSTSWIETSGVHEPLNDSDGVSSSLIKGNKSLQTQVHGWNNGKNRDSYNFYQAVDGQNLILHPLNMKCLLQHYGSYDKLPNRITGKILQLESLTQSETMRRRYRYLSHFSLTATFQFCEIDLSVTLPIDALFPFMDEINSREKQRKQLARKEHREKIKAKAAGLRFMPVTLNFEHTSHDESSIFSMDDFEALGSFTATSSSPSPPNIGGERQSFSDVARLGFAAGHDSPALKTEDADSQLRTEVSRGSSGASGVARNDSGPSFANVASRGKATERQEGGEVNKMAGKKGKKAGRILLSTTSGGRRY